MIPKSDTIQIVEFELEGARAWAGRYQVPLDWLEADLELRATLTQPATGQPFFLKGVFDDYKEIPPSFTFCTENWQVTNEKRNFPKPPPHNPFGSSIFVEHQGRPVICAPFNRLAYSQKAGPHNDWGDLVQWQTAAKGHVQATFIGDMLQVILRDANISNGRMGE